jgi:hypothetical protein
MRLKGMVAETLRRRMWRRKGTSGGVEGTGMRRVDMYRERSNSSSSSSSSGRDEENEEFPLPEMGEMEVAIG